MAVGRLSPSKMAWALAFSLLASAPASALDRESVIETAKEHTYLPWHCGPENLVVDCGDGWESDFTEGDYIGVAYDWDGSMTSEEYLAGLADGLGAGSHSWHGSLSCTVGLDCSGFVTQCWQSELRLSTATIPNSSWEIGIDDLLPGDAWNNPGSHVVLHSGWLEDGRPTFYEATPPLTKHTTDVSPSYLVDYTPVRYAWMPIEQEVPGLGTVSDPHLVNSFPYLHFGNTALSDISNFDAYACDPDKAEPGPEIYYRIELPTSGLIDISLSSPANTDVDPHLLASLDADDCLQRHDRHIAADLSAGTYFLVADTYHSAEQAGPYKLTIDFTPDEPVDPVDPPTENESGCSCQTGPAQGSTIWLLVLMAALAGSRRKNETRERF